MKLSFINKGIFESHKSPVEIGESSYIYRYIYIYMYVCMYVCICICICICGP